MNKRIGLMALVAAVAFGVATSASATNVLLPSDFEPLVLKLAENETVDCGFIIDSVNGKKYDGVPLLEVGEGEYMFALPGTPGATYDRCAEPILVSL